MPFIWNDERAEFSDLSAEFDRNEFVVVRKLFIQFKKDAKVRQINVFSVEVHRADLYGLFSQHITESWIQQKFQSYGQIEHIEVFAGENSATWAYITFFEDEHAYAAFTDVSSNKPFEIEKILPADSWCQPATTEPAAENKDNTVPETESMKQLQDEISKLNLNAHDHDDASELLRRILASTNDQWKTSMVRKNERLARNFTFVVVVSEYAPNIPLAKARSILRTIGPYVCDLCVNFRDNKWPANIERFFYKMCQYVGVNLKTLRLINVPNNEDWLKQLKPLLARIETLHVAICNYDFDFDIDFQSYCPNLKTLKIRMNLKGELLTKPWPKLESLSIRDNQYMEERLVLEFMKNNPQLKYFKVAANDCDNFLPQISEHLHNVEKLCLYQAYPNISTGNLTHLAELKHLKKLKLMYLEEEEFDGIVDCLPKFKQLQELKLHVFYDGLDTVDADDLFQPNLDAIVNLAQELHELDGFHLRYCQIHNDMLYDFIRNARNLKQIRIYRCGLEISDEVLEHIESIRKSVNPTKLLFYADKVSSELNREVRIFTSN